MSDIKARLREAANAHGLVSVDLIRGIFQDSLARIEALEAERDRLREAVETAIAWAETCDCITTEFGPGAANRTRKLLRAALAPPCAPAEETGQAQDKGWFARQAARTAEDIKQLPDWLRERPPAAEGARLASEPHFRGSPLLGGGNYDMTSVMVSRDWYARVIAHLRATPAPTPSTRHQRNN